ncbi:MAG: hypothetical protein KTR31_05975 [Myxococcales bacterium]|nr:hypothetical protein [Myxococcales bacterium]
MTIASGLACAGITEPAPAPPEDDLIVHEAETGLLADQPDGEPSEPVAPQPTPEPDAVPEPQPAAPEPQPTAPEPTAPEPQPTAPKPQPSATSSPAPQPAAPEPTAASSRPEPAPAAPKTKHPIGPKPAGLEQLGPQRWQLSAELFAQIKRKPAELGRMTKDGPGFRLHGVRPRHGYHLGLRNRDLLLRINGRKLRNQGQVEAAFEALQDEGQFEMLLERRGQERVHTYVIGG